jgi:2-keto-3-deoxy-L-rhamnonate aldolase RhmA
MVTHQTHLFPDVEDPVGNWISIGHPAVAEVCAHGFDFVVVDTEHTDIGLETLANVLRAVETVEGDVSTFVRVPWNDPVEIKQVLDLGPDGVIVPMIEDADQARQAVRAMRYPPAGIRGVGPGRAAAYGRSFDEYVERADEELTTIVQIETAAGVEHADEIAGVDGVDAVLVGQGDLSGSLGVLGEWNADEFRTALGTIVDAVHAAGKPLCMLAMDDEGIPRWVAAGADILIAGVDVAYLAKGSDAARDAFESARARPEDAD